MCERFCTEYCEKVQTKVGFPYLKKVYFPVMLKNYVGVPRTTSQNILETNFG